MILLRYFFYIAAGALASSLVGGAFACVVALVSPEFVKGLFSPPESSNLVRYAAAVGMIWGVFLGTAGMGLSLLLLIVVQGGRVFREWRGESGSPGRTKSQTPQSAP